MQHASASNRSLQYLRAKSRDPILPLSFVSLNSKAHGLHHSFLAIARPSKVYAKGAPVPADPVHRTRRGGILAIRWGIQGLDAIPACSRSTSVYFLSFFFSYYFPRSCCLERSEEYWRTARKKLWDELEDKGGESERGGVLAVALHSSSTTRSHENLARAQYLVFFSSSSLLSRALHLI
jgi:hypothetical protein